MSTQFRTQLEVAARQASPFTPTLSGLVQRKCACGGSLGLDHECGECRRKGLASQPPLVQTKLQVNQPGNRYEQEADRMAKQVTYAAGSYSSAEHCLSATEPIIQRQPADDEEVVPEQAASAPVEAVETPAEPVAEPAPAPSEPTAESATTAEVPTGGLIVEDDEAREITPGQMRKGAFLDEMRASACAVANAELAAVGRSTEGCPYIERWIGYYRTRDSVHIERAIRKYAPETAGAMSAREYIPLVSERIRQGVARWARTGELTGVPEELLSQAMGGGLLGAIGGAVSSVAGAVSSVVSGIGSLLFKEREGGVRDAEQADAQHIQAQLGGGSPLDSGVRARMEAAFGHDFSRVRVHTDGQAASLSLSLNARAFTIGSDVAFGASEYRPGTPVGDALIAHELAHVAQQGGATTAAAPLQKGEGTYNALEEDADVSAMGAVVSLWSGAKGGLAKVAQNTMPRLRSGLRLSRCKDESAPSGAAKSAPTGTPTTVPSAAPPMKTVSLHIVHLEKGPASHDADLTQGQETYKQANVKLNVVKSLPFDDAKTKSLIGDDYVLDEFTSVGTPTAEEAKLTSEAAGRTDGAISMYYVKGMSRGSTGESFWPKDWPTVKPSVVITSKDSKETFSHELGHVLLNDGGHHPDRDNLMFTTNFKFNLDETQRKTIHNSPFAK